jgi:hypothetical protein
MIVRLLRNQLPFCCFSFAGYKKIGREVVAELPQIVYPTKPKPTEDERMPTSLAYQTFRKELLTQLT